MSKVEPFGFELILYKEFTGTRYDIRDLASNEPVFEVSIIGDRKPEFYLQNTNGKDILVLKRISSRSNVYRFFKEGIRLGTFSYSASCCNTNYEVETDKKIYVGSGFIGSTFQFVGKNGKVSFEIYKGFKEFRSNLVVEVFEGIEPEIAILVGTLLDQISLKKQKDRISGTDTQMPLHM